MNKSENNPKTETTTHFDLSTIVADAIKVVSNPVDFYRNMTISGGYSKPLVFVVVMAAIYGILMFFMSLIGVSFTGAMIAGGFAAIIFFPIMSLIGSFIGAALLFVIWKLMGSERNYEAAYHSLAYSTAILPITLFVDLVPYLGGVISVLWSMFLTYTASVEVAKVKAQTAKIVFGILAALFAIIGLAGERAENKWSSRAQQLERSIDSSPFADTLRKLENGDDVSPEEAGRAAGEFLKGLEKFSEGLEQASKDDE